MVSPPSDSPRPVAEVPLGTVLREWGRDRLVLVLLGCGAVELAFRSGRSVRSAPDDAAGKLCSVISAPALLAAKAPALLAAGAAVTAGSLALVA
jgi:hypothetical protein